jgi:hypothetical protein
MRISCRAAFRPLRQRAKVLVLRPKGRPTRCVAYTVKKHLFVSLLQNTGMTAQDALVAAKQKGFADVLQHHENPKNFQLFEADMKQRGIKF